MDGIKNNNQSTDFKYLLEEKVLINLYRQAYKRKFINKNINTLNSEILSYNLKIILRVTNLVF